jgi:hypothetical protein
MYANFYTLLTNLYQKTSDITVLKDLLDEFDHFLDTGKESDRYPYVLLLKARLLYNYLDRDAGAALFDTLREKYGFDKDFMAEMESVINE